MTGISLGELRDYLDYFANESGIEVVYSYDMGPNTTDFVMPKLKTIILNMHYQTSVSLAFRLAHEISHLLYGDYSSQNLYHFSPLCVTFEERAAHVGAIHLIAKYVYKEVPKEYRNYKDFIDILGLPSSFENMVIEELQEL